MNKFDRLEQQNIGKRIMAVNIIQEENKKSFSSVSIDDLAKWMGCEKDSVSELLDYITAFDWFEMAEKVIRRCQSCGLLCMNGMNEEKIFCYFLWILKEYGEIFICKEKVHSFIASIPEINRIHTGVFAYGIPQESQDQTLMADVIAEYVKYVKELITDAEKNGIEQDVLEQILFPKKTEESHALFSLWIQKNKEVENKNKKVKNRLN